MGWLAKHSDTINAIAGNSFQYRSLAEGDEKKTLWNYDSWAYRQTWWYPLSQPEYFSYNIMTWFNLHIMPTGSQVISVNSAFGGMTIYRLQNFIKGEYNGRDCEHVTFHYSLKQANPDFQLVVNPSQIMLMS